MQYLKDRIVKDGKVLGGDVLKVDSFLNHQLDVNLLSELGKEFYRLFEEYKITKILTVEASGIPIACFAAQHFDVPVVFAKKGHHKNIGNDVFTAEVFSFTKGTNYTIFVSKKYLSEDDNILIIDDFLANGQAVLGLKKIVEDARATLCGVGIAIEKGFQPGGKQIRDLGVKVKSLAIIDSMTDDSISFREDD